MTPRDGKIRVSEKSFSQRWVVFREMTIIAKQGAVVLNTECPTPANFAGDMRRINHGI
jgi:hypothetical protein